MIGKAEREVFSERARQKQAERIKIIGDCARYKKQEQFNRKWREDYFTQDLLGNWVTIAESEKRKNARP